MNDEEIRRIIELERYFVILPAFKSIYEKIDYDYPRQLPVKITQPYNSRTDNTMNQTELKEYLLKHNLAEIE